jgi:CBS domain-containing protein
MFNRPVREFRPYETACEIPPDAKIAAIVDAFVRAPDLHHVCIVDEGSRLLGLLNRKRLFKSIFSHHIAADSRISSLLQLHTAEISSDIMITDIVTTTESEEIDAVIARMIEKNIREVPVMDENGRVIGFLTLLMLMKKWLSRREKG